MKTRFSLALLLMLSVRFLSAATANITLDAATTVTSFYPVSVFGNNVAFWVDEPRNLATQAKVEAAGNYFLRYPGGSSSDDYHWNGTGTFNAAYHWVPDDTHYTSGFRGTLQFRGTTSSSYGTYSFVTDNDNYTWWLSCADTDYPDHQWVYLDLGSAVNADSVTITWWTPYATQFSLQLGDSLGYASPYNSSDESFWFNIVPPLTGTGGTQGVTFASTPMRYLRVLMTSSSAGPGGQYAIAEIRVYNGATQVSHNVTHYQNQSRTWASSHDPSSTTGNSVSFDFEAFMDYCQLFTPPAIPIITVNMGTGTPQEAAAWVHYANKTAHPGHPDGYGIKYWEVGNEMNGDWETGGPLNARDYARRYILFYEAMKAEDPGILISGPVANSPYAASNCYNTNSYIREFVDRLALDGKAGYAEGINFHWYAWWANSDEATCLNTPNQWSNFAASLPGMLVNHPNPTTVPLYMGEYNSGGASNLTVRLVNGLWLVNWLGEYIRLFGPRANGHLWDVLNGGNALSSPTGGDHAYLQTEANAYQFQERAHYWTMKMLADNWALRGSGVAHALLQTTTDQSYYLAAYTTRRPDGALALIVVNKNPSTSYDTTLHLNSFFPESTADRWTFDASNYAWSTASSPYHADPDLPPTAGVQSGVAGSFTTTFPPYSVTVFEFHESDVTPTPTATPPPLPTATETPDGGPVEKPVLFPNPATGPEPVILRFNVPEGVQKATVRVFTPSFRLVNDVVLKELTAGRLDYPLSPTDQEGRALANGVYHVVVGIGGERYFLKLLVLR